MARASLLKGTDRKTLGENSILLLNKPGIVNKNRLLDKPELLNNIRQNTDYLLGLTLLLNTPGILNRNRLLDKPELLNGIRPVDIIKLVDNKGLLNLCGNSWKLPLDKKSCIMHILAAN